MEQDFVSFSIKDIYTFKQKLVHWANYFSVFSFLDSNQCQDAYGKYDFILGVDKISEVYNLETIPKNEFYFGFISYEYHHLRFDIKEEKKAYIEFPDCFFFKPRYIIYCQNGRVYINRNSIEAMYILDSIDKIDLKQYTIPKYKFERRTDRVDYLNTIYSIQNNIRNGQYYELNYCVEFYNENIEINPINTFLIINEKARSPMSALVKMEDKWILSFSPERLTALRGDNLISQPIKGTARRNLTNKELDNQIKSELKNSTKERAENTMIVDLIRHDMTPYAHTGSIKVKELCEIYTFPFVHQMISTIEANLRDKSDAILALKNLLPAGSMTGAPKKEVIGVIHSLENFRRGIYSGNIGYIDSEGDFDFNVVIRTLQYDEKNHKICLNVGGAITLLSDAETEYKECLLKAEGILNFFE